MGQHFVGVGIIAITVFLYRLKSFTNTIGYLIFEEVVIDVAVYMSLASSSSR
jgi:hypothetical protein